MAPHVWTVDDLPECRTTAGSGSPSSLATLVFNVFVIGALLWMQVVQPIPVDGTSFPLFDPALWSFWLPWFIVVPVIEIVFTVLLWLADAGRRATRSSNAVLSAAFALPAVYLLLNDMLFDPALVAAVTAVTAGTAWMHVTGKIVAAVLILIAGYDAIDGFMKARRRAWPRPARSLRARRPGPARRHPEHRRPFGSLYRLNGPVPPRGRPGQEGSRCLRSPVSGVGPSPSSPALSWSRSARPAL